MFSSPYTPVESMLEPCQSIFKHYSTMEKPKKTMFPWVKSTFSMAKSNLFHLFPSFFHHKFPLFHLKKTTETAHLSAQLRRLSGLLGPQPLIAFSGVNQINGDFSQ